MTKEEFLKESENLDFLLKNQKLGVVEYFAAKCDLEKEYIAYLEMYLNSVKGQCKAQDEVIKLAESKLGNGFWQSEKCGKLLNKNVTSQELYDQFITQWCKEHNE